MLIKLALGAALVLGATVAAIFTDGSDVSVVMALNLFAPLLLASLGVLLAGPGRAAVDEVFRGARSGADGATRVRIESTLKAYGRALWISALLCFIIHFTLMLKNLEDKAALWPNLAWALAPFVAALVLHAGLRLPLAHAAAWRGGASVDARAAPAEKAWSPGRWLAGMGLSLAGIVSFEFGAFATNLFVDLPSFLLLVFVPMGLALAGLRPRELRLAFATLRSGAPSLEEAERAVRAFRYLGSAFRVAGLLGASTGFVLLVRYWQVRQRIGPSVALLVISVFWSLLVYLVAILPLEAAAERHCLRSGGLATRESPGAGTMR